MTGSNNPTPTVSMQTTLGEMLQMAVKQRESHSIARFDVGQGREVAFVAICNDANGYLTTIQCYAEMRDQYAGKVANAVADDFVKNGAPDPDNPRPLNIIPSFDGEAIEPPEFEG